MIVREVDFNFVEGFRELQRDAAEVNKKAGFSDDDALWNEFEDWFDNATAPLDQWGSRNRYMSLFQSFRNARTGLKLALAVGEIGETLEAVRKNLGPDAHIPDFTAEEAEAADVIIRLMNYATDRNLRLAEAIVAKNNYNRTRQDHTKEGRAAEHGKRF